jgi:hypothetical protein
MKHGFSRIKNRRLVIQYVRSLNGLGKEMKKLKFTRNIGRELGRNSPSWFADPIEIVEEVQESMPSLSRRSFLWQKLNSADV